MIDNVYLANLLEKEFNNNSLGKKFLIFADEGDMVKSTKDGNKVLSFTNGLLDTITSQVTPIKNLRFQNWNMQLMLLCDLAKTGYVKQGDYNRLQSDNLLDIKQCIMEVFDRLNGQTLSIVDEGKVYSMTFALSLPTTGEKMSLGEISEGMPIYTDITMTLFENGVNSADYNVIVDGENMYFTNAVISRLKVTEQNPNIYGNNTKASVMNNGIGIDLVIPQISSPVCDKIEDEMLDGTDKAYCVILQRGDKKVPYICTNLKGQQSVALAQNIGINISFGEAVEECLEFEENKWLNFKEDIIEKGLEKQLINKTNAEIIVFWGDGNKDILSSKTIKHIYNEQGHYEIYAYNSKGQNNEWLNEIKLNYTYTSKDQYQYQYDGENWWIVGVPKTSLENVSLTIPYSLETEFGEVSVYGIKSTENFAEMTNISNYENVVIEYGIKEIGDDTFFGDWNLSTITIPNTVNKIGKRAFRNCTNLVELKLPQELTSIGDLAFINCQQLVKVIIPNNVSQIGELAFGGCINLTEIVVEAIIPPTLSNTNAISTATSTIYVPLESLLEYKNSNIWKEFDNIIMPNVSATEGLVYTGLDFEGNIATSETTIVQYAIGDYSLSNGNGYTGTETKVYIPTYHNGKPVTQITAVAFNSTNIEEILIPSTITNIGSLAMGGSTILKKIYIFAETPPEIVSISAIGVDLDNSIIYVPINSLELYKTHEIWGFFADLMQGI